MNILKFLTLPLIGLSLSLSAMAAQLTADTTQTSGVKSYFLLKLNLDTDPVDVQNYLNNLDFKNQFKAFADAYHLNLAQLDQPATTLINRAMDDGLNGNLDQSCKRFIEAINLKGVQADLELQMAIYGLSGQLMQLKGNYEKAADYQLQAYQISITKNLPNNQAWCYAQLGKIKSMQGQYKEAEDYLIRKALPAFSRMKDHKGMVLCYRQIADSYLRQELFSQAKWFYLQSLTLARQINYQPGVIAALIELGQFKYDVADFEPAYKDWHEAEQIAISTHDLPVLLKLKFNLARTLKKLGNISAAEKYAMEFEQLKDILLNPVL